MTIQRILSLIVLALGSFTATAQTCYCCDGLGVVYEREYVTEYDNLSIGTTSGWNARDVYHYTSKRNVRKTVQKKCSCCNGSGNRPKRQRRAAPRRQEPKVRYVTPSEMHQLSLHKFKQGYEKVTNLGGGYYYARFKHRPRKGVLAKVHSDKQGYELILKGLERFQTVYDQDGNFMFYCFVEERGYFYYDINVNFQFSTWMPSANLGFNNLFWVETEKGAKLMRAPSKRLFFEGDFQIRKPEFEEKALWQKHGLLLAKSNDAMGVINGEGKFVVPPLFDKIKIDHPAKVFEMLDEKTSIYHYFNFDGSEILVQPTLFKTCDNGDEIYEFTRNVYLEGTDEKSKIQKRKVYELKAKASTQGLPPYYQYCSCYNEDGIAKVVKFNSKDTILADVNGKLIDQEEFARIKSRAEDFPLPDEKTNLVLHRLIEDNEYIKVKSINGKNKYACRDYKKGAFVFDEIILLYPNSFRAFAANENGRYRIFQSDKDFGYNKVKSTYQAVDLGAVSRDIVPVQDKKGKWGAVFLSGDKKEFRQVLAPKYDRLEYLGFGGKNNDIYAAWDNGKVEWFDFYVWNKRETKLLPYKKIEEQTEFNDHIRWMNKSKQLRAFTLHTLFKYYDVDPKRDLVNYSKDGFVHLLDIGDDQQMLWCDDYRGEVFHVSKDIASIKLTRQSRRVEGIQEYIDLYLNLKYKDGQIKKAKAIYLKDEWSYRVHQFNFP